MGATFHISRRAVTSLAVKKAGIALLDPTQTAGEPWMASCVRTGNFVAALLVTAEFRLGDHALLMRESREDIQWKHAEAAETALGEAWAAASKKYT